MKIIEANIFTYMRGMYRNIKVPTMSPRIVMIAIPENIPAKTFVPSYFDASDIVIN